MNNDAEEKNTSSVNSSLSLVILGMVLLNGAFSAYVVNYYPKIGFLSYLDMFSFRSATCYVFSMGSRAVRDFNEKKVQITKN